MESPFLGLGAAIVWCIVHLAHPATESTADRLKGTQRMTSIDIERICRHTLNFPVMFWVATKA